MPTLKFDREGDNENAGAIMAYVKEPRATGIVINEVRDALGRTTHQTIQLADGTTERGRLKIFGMLQTRSGKSTCERVPVYEHRHVLGLVRQLLYRGWRCLFRVVHLSLPQMKLQPPRLVIVLGVLVLLHSVLFRSPGVHQSRRALDSPRRCRCGSDWSRLLAEQTKIKSPLPGESKGP
jgi:hypothetical protein